MNSDQNYTISLKDLAQSLKTWTVRLKTCYKNYLDFVESLENLYESLSDFLSLEDFFYSLKDFEKTLRLSENPEDCQKVHGTWWKNRKVLEFQTLFSPP